MITSHMWLMTWMLLVSTCLGSMLGGWISVYICKSNIHNPLGWLIWRIVTVLLFLLLSFLVLEYLR